MAEYDSEEEVKKEPPPEQPGKKFFISHANSYEGKCLFKELWNKEKCRDPELAAHSFYGTIKSDERNMHGAFEEAPLGFERFVQFDRTQEFRQTLLECDVIVYDLLSNKFEEVDYVIKTLKTSDLTQQKTLVLLSSVMAWVNTPPKFKEEKPEGEEGEEEEEPEEEEEEEDEEEEEEKKDDDEEEKEEELDENGEPIIVQKPIFFKETDYHLRVPHHKYQHLKTLETVALSSTNTQPNLRVHVLCSGLRYGNGERTLYDHFQKAWIQDPPALVYSDSGENLVPSIHIIDLARLVRRVVVEDPRVYPYIFAIDKTKRPTQKRIVQAISKGMGTNQIASAPKEAIPDSQWKDFLTINLKMKASDTFKDGQLSPEEEENLEEEEQEALVKEKQFPWHTQKGIVGFMAKLNMEFNDFRGLNPVKILVSGPPASGKTFFAEKLAKYYNIPRIHVKQLTDEAFRLAAIDDDDAGEDEFIAEIKAKVEELRDTMVEQIEEARGEPEGDEEPEEIDRESLAIRIPDNILHRILQKKLNENACRNRGYVIDGFPRTHKDCQYTFLKREIKYDADGEVIEEDEEELEEGEEKNFDGYIKDESIFPGSCIVLDGKDSDLISRVRDLTLKEVEGTHYTEKDMQRRIKDYRLANNSEVAEPSVSDFFSNQGMQVFTEQITTDAVTAFNAFKIYVERNEKPNNYMIYDLEDEKARIQAVAIAAEKKELARKAVNVQEENLEAILKKQKEAATKSQLIQLRNKQKEDLDAKSQPIRQYLLDNLFPFLTDGLIEVCKARPEDPTDFLAEYLFRRSVEVPYPDPTTY